MASAIKTQILTKKTKTVMQTVEVPVPVTTEEEQSGLLLALTINEARFIRSLLGGISNCSRTGIIREACWDPMEDLSSYELGALSDQIFYALKDKLAGLIVSHGE